MTLSTVVLQSVEIPDLSTIDIAVTLGSSAATTAVTTIVIGAIMVALAPNYTEARMDTIRENVVGSFFYGLASLVFFILVIFVLFITLIGIPLALLFGLFVFIAWTIGAVIAFLAIADSLVGHESGWLVPLVLAGAINGALTFTGIGFLVSFCVGAAGFGAVLRTIL